MKKYLAKTSHQTKNLRSLDFFSISIVLGKDYKKSLMIFAYLQNGRGYSVYRFSISHSSFIFENRKKLYIIFLLSFPTITDFKKKKKPKKPVFVSTTPQKKFAFGFFVLGIDNTWKNNEKIIKIFVYFEIDETTMS